MIEQVGDALPAAEGAEAYRQLAAAPSYRSQRDNAKNPDTTCNFTSQAMAFEAVGVNYRELPYRLATTDEGHSQYRRSMPLRACEFILGVKERLSITLGFLTIAGLEPAFFHTLSVALALPLSRHPLSHKIGEGKRKLSLPLAHFVGEGSGAARG